MDVDLIPLQRPRVGKNLHPVDKTHNPVGFVANEANQRAILIAEQFGSWPRRECRTADF